MADLSSEHVHRLPKASSGTRGNLSKRQIYCRATYTGVQKRLNLRQSISNSARVAAQSQIPRNTKSDRRIWLVGKIS
jgi:hypothetical protein